MSLRLRRGTDAERAAVVFDAGEIVYTTDTEQVWVGDGSTPGGMLISSDQVPAELSQDLDLNSNDIVGTGNININGAVQADQFTGSLVGDVVGSVFADDSTIIVNGQTGVVTASLVGDVNGSVFGDDSTVLVDSVNNVLSAQLANIETLNFLEQGLALDGVNIKSSNNGESKIRLVRPNALPNGSPVAIGTLFFDTYLDNGSESTTAYIQSYGSEDPTDNYAKTYLELNVIDEDGNVVENNVITLTYDGKTGFGTFTPTEKLDVRGSGVFTGNVSAASAIIAGEVQAAAFKGTLVSDDSSIIIDGVTGAITAPSAIIAGEVQAAAFKGTLVGDDSSIIIDGITGAITSPSYVQFGSLTTTERNALTATNGMVIYNTTDNKFQGYEAGSWVNLI
jgi:cytoskeletal protein CcmA (bactofilin family)